MPNPFNILNPSNPMNLDNLNNYKNIYKMLTSKGNPMQLLNQMAGSNPNMQPILDLINKGANPKDIFNDMCKQRGINPDEFINNITR
jgi:hypothetical protein